MRFKNKLLSLSKMKQFLGIKKSPPQVLAGGTPTSHQSETAKSISILSDLPVDVKKIMRPSIQTLKGYSCAKDEADTISTTQKYCFLDANENPYTLPNTTPKELTPNYYPDTYQTNLRKKIADFHQLPIDNIIAGNGSDELIDQLIRLFCEPKKDSILICPPTFGMYAVSANMNDIGVEAIPLREESITQSNGASRTTMTLEVEKIIKSNAKICFIPNPAAPTGGLFEREKLLYLLENFSGVVVMDEAYVNFSGSESFVNYLRKNKNASTPSNLVVLQTFSKFWGLAGVRVGMCFADKRIIEKLQIIKMPYSLSAFQMDMAIDALENYDFWQSKARITLSERKKLEAFLEEQSWVRTIYKSDANFIFFQVDAAEALYKKLMEAGIIIRKFDHNQLRISIGTPEQMRLLKEVLSEY